MKTPKFYPNQPDDNHCLQAAVMMVWNTIDGPMSWEEVNRMTQYEDGLYSWIPPALVGLSKKIPNSRLISRMDYQQFADRGEEYLREYLNLQWFELQRSHASPGFKKEQTAAKQLVESGLIEKKSIDREMIEKLLAENLLIALVDAGRLAEENWSAGHFVVLYNQDDGNFYLHDPGLPPRQNWIVNKGKLVDAFKDELIVVPWLRQ